MYALKQMPDAAAHNGILDLSFEDTSSWMDNPHPGTTGGKAAILRIGDPDAGPLFIITAFPPMTEEVSRGPAHSHDSDNWRITLLGETNMGRARYLAGEFRFQNGGVPYPDDNLAWGPEGGFGIVLMADRRGFPVRPVKKEIAERVAPFMAKLAESYGVTVLDPYPFGPAVATSIGRMHAGKLEGSFADAGRWLEVAPGCRAGVALLGDRCAGPIMLLLRAAPGATLLPAASFDTELLSIVVEGSCVQGDDTVPFATMRLCEAGVAAAPLVAGPDGASVAVVIGDRRAWPPRLDASADAWRTALAAVIDDLTDEIWRRW